jgi:ribosomal protein L37AE/L43A
VTPDCPFCESAQTPEQLRPGLFLCPCCGKVFEAPVGELPSAASGVSGRVRAMQIERKDQDE